MLNDSPLQPLRCTTCNGTGEVTRGERNPNVPWETTETVEPCPNTECRNGVVVCNSCGQEDAVAIDADGYECCAVCLAENVGPEPVRTPTPGRVGGGLCVAGSPSSGGRGH